MKKIAVVCCCVVMWLVSRTQTHAQYLSASRSYASMHTYSKPVAEQLQVEALPSFALQVNPLGLLQFGPIVQAEFRVAESGHYIVPHLRVSYLGVLYHLVVIDGEDDVTVSPAALGLGVGYKKLFAVNSGAWYVGGAMDFSFGSAEARTSDNRFANFNLMANGGWRWRNPDKKFVFGLGALVGPSFAFLDETDYGTRIEDERTTSVFGMLELTLGWEFE